MLNFTELSNSPSIEFKDIQVGDTVINLNVEEDGRTIISPAFQVNAISRTHVSGIGRDTGETYTCSGNKRNVYLLANRPVDLPEPYDTAKVREILTSANHRDSDFDIDAAIKQIAHLAKNGRNDYFVFKVAVNAIHEDLATHALTTQLETQLDLGFPYHSYRVTYSES